MSATAPSAVPISSVVSQGLPIVLPPNARLDLAYQTYAFPSGQAATSNVTYAPPGGSYAIPLNMFGNLTTGAGAGTRQVIVQLKDATGNVLANMAPAATQPANTPGQSYTFGLGLASVVSPSGYTVTPLPVWTLRPAETIALSVAGGMSGDSWAQLAFSILIIPSGPRIAPATLTLVPTPLIA